MTYLLQSALLGCVFDVAGAITSLESNQSLYYSAVKPIYRRFSAIVFYLPLHKF